MYRPVHFDLYSSAPDKSSGFLQKVFNWDISSWGGPMDYMLITTGKKDESGIDGGLSKDEGMFGQNVIFTIEIPDLDSYMEKVTDNGGELLTGKHTVPGVGYLAYFREPGGIVFAMMQEDINAGK